MRSLVNRLAVILGTAVSFVGVGLILLLVLKQSGPMRLADAAGFVVPILLFSLPLTSTIIGFMIAGRSSVGKGVYLFIVGLSLASTLNLLFVLASVPLGTAFPFGMVAMISVLVLTFGLLFFRPVLGERILADHVYYTAVILGILEGLIVVMAIAVGRSSVALLSTLVILALLIGIGPAVGLVNQARRQSLQPASFVALWCGVANLFGAAFLGITSVGNYFFLAALIIVICTLVVQFTAPGDRVSPGDSVLSG